MDDPRQLSVDINIVVGLAPMQRPDLVTGVTPDELRRIALDALQAVRAERSVPEPFRRAFAEPDR